MAKKQKPGIEHYVDDCVLPGEKVLSDQECAYRRGYQQGAYVALQALKDGGSFEAVWKWASIRLRRWRFKGHPQQKGVLVTCERPPAPPEETRNEKAAQ